jgi:hypothetical protein
MTLDLLSPNFARIIRTPADVKDLNQLILELVVRGKLVPQDPADEPAKVLSGGIRAYQRNNCKGSIDSIHRISNTQKRGLHARLVTLCHI